MIIDAHAHAAGPYSEPESLLASAREHGLEKIVLCPGPKSSRQVREPPNLGLKNKPESIYVLNRLVRFAYAYFIKANGDGNAYVHALQERLPDLVRQFLWVNPLDSNQMSDLERNIDRFGVSGIKVHQAWNPFSIESRQFHKLVEIAHSRKLPVFIHLYSKPETRKLCQFMKDNPDPVFIIAHMLGLEVFGKERQCLKSIYFDTSGSDRVRGEDIQEAINLFGCEHVIFGSDTPYARIQDQIQKIGKLHLSADVTDHIMAINIKRLLSPT
jgi:predicted TIM-barrel fold metal-dependent hydrolase